MSKINNIAAILKSVAILKSAVYFERFLEKSWSVQALRKIIVGSVSEKEISVGSVSEMVTGWQGECDREKVRGCEGERGRV